LDRASSDSRFGGVDIGIISYSFRQISYKPEDVAKGMQFLGLRVLELEQAFFEQALGAPRDPTGGGQPQLPGSEVAGGPFGNAPGHAIEPEPRREEHGGEGEDAETKAVRAELRRWRMSPPWEKVRALKRMFDDRGIEVRLVKFPQLGGQEMTDEEVDYCFEFARTMGARGLTCEPPLSQTKRLARFANRHRMIIGFHGHSNVSSVETFGRPGAWEQAFFYSPYHWANIDLGHFTAGNSYPPTEFIREYHDRITNIHLKDRKIHNGPNLPWGQGDTPIKETLQLMKREKYKFPAMIELEYKIPQGSTVMDELVKCVNYCREALA
jgi:sugar phosphate isomerase/epimerase